MGAHGPHELGDVALSTSGTVGNPIRDRIGPEPVSNEIEATSDDRGHRGDLSG
jgi:hypothetical protein